MATKWLVRIRDPNYVTLAEVDDYQAADLLPTFNDVGSWSLTVRADLAVAQYLVVGNGVLFSRDVGDGNGFQVVLSGPIWDLDRQGTQDNVLIASGPDDLFWLKARMDLPQPGAADITAGATGTFTPAYDTRTGVASTVIQAYVNAHAGPGAIAARQVPGLSLAADPVIGTSVTGNARFDGPLLTLLQQLALSGGDIGFRIVQVGTGLVFSCYQPVTRAGALFSLDLGNLHDFAWARKGPATNYVYVLGGGVGTARVIAEATDAASIAAYGRVESLLDARDTSDAATMAQRGHDEVLKQKETSNLAMTPIDTAALAWGRDYTLGDRVSVVIDGTTVTDVVRQIHIALSPAAGDVVTPAVGTPAAADAQVSAILGGLVAQIRALHRRVARLEGAP